MQFPVSKVPSAVVEVARALSDAGYGAWVVGGCVRDLLLGREASDWDLATSAKPEEVRKVFRRVIPTGVEHGTVTVLHRGEAFEVTTLRGERGYSDGRRPDEVFFVTDIDADLARRDFTINAIAYDPLHEDLIDPFSGMSDLAAGLIRAVGDPKRRFAEDGLRVLRAARFAATLDFEIEESTLAAMRPSLSVFRKVSAERVRDEWTKAMRAEKPSRAFEVMLDVGILEVVLPELLDQVGCEQNAYHEHPVWEHTMACVDAASRNDPVLRMAALLHDIAKPITRSRSEKTNDYTFFNHEKVGASVADAWLKKYKFSNDERETIVALIRQHLICYESSWSDAAIRRFVKRVGRSRLERLFALAVADAVAKGAPAKGNPEDVLALLEELRRRIDEVAAQGTALRAKDLVLGGRDIMRLLNVSPGPVIGDILDALLERVIDDPSLNTKESLEPLARELATRYGHVASTPSRASDAHSKKAT